MGERWNLFVVAADYGSVNVAELDYEAIKAVFRGAPETDDCAAMVQHDLEGRVRVLRKFERSTHRGAMIGVFAGLVVGVAIALLSSVTLTNGLTVVAALGAAVGGGVGHIWAGLDNQDLRRVAAALDRGHAGVIAVVSPSMLRDLGSLTRDSDAVAVARLADLGGNELGDQLRASRSSDPNREP